MPFELISAFSIGLLGSFHCVGMCGPIALALPVNSKSAFRRTLAILIYNIGRVITYGLLGFVMGLVGKSFSLFGFQQWASIIAGAGVLLFLLFNTILKRNLFSSAKMVGWLKKPFARLLKKPENSSLFFIGLLNGFLPCGLVYTALFGAIATNHLFYSTLFMILFGLGTVPMMAFVTFSSKKISLGFRNKLRKTVPLFVGCMGILLIARGLNLGIPFISPKLQKDAQTNEQKIDCCEKPKTTNSN